jgi:putative transposase
MRNTFKYRLYPTTAQAKTLDCHLALCRELYTAALQERRDAWRLARRSIGFAEQSAQLPAIKLARLDATQVYSHVLQDVLHRVDRAFQAFFRRAAAGTRPGYPRCRSTRRDDSLTDPQLGFALDGCRLLLSKLGRLTGKLHRPVEGTIKTLTLTRAAGPWSAGFSVEHAPQRLPPSTKELGLDLGLTAFAALSTGTDSKHPRPRSHAQATLRIAQRRVARRHRGSTRRRTAVLLRQKTHARVRRQRADFHHKEARKLVTPYGFIAVEDLKVKGLARGRLAKSVADAGGSSFRSTLAHKAADAGREFRRVDPRGTSQACLCGAGVPKTLRDRWHACPACELSAPRDIVSAKLVLHRARMEPSGANVAEPIACVA